MHIVYKALAPENIERIITYCKNHSVQKGGVFEVYPEPGGLMTLVVVNANPDEEPLEKFKPLGTFYCNYLGPGILSLDEEDPNHDGMPSTQFHSQVLKQVIDRLIGITTNENGSNG